MKNDKERTPEERKAELKEKLAKATNKERAAIAKILQIKLLTELTALLNNLESVAEDQWKKLITKLKNYKKYIKLDGDVFATFIAMLLPLLGAYLGCMFTFKKNKENEIAASVPEVQFPDSDSFIETEEEFVECLHAQSDNELVDNSKILQWCKDKKYDFAFNLEEPDNENEGQTSEYGQDDCMISLCPPEESSNLAAIAKFSPLLNEPKGVIVEFDSKYEHKINVQVGSVISFNEHIGNIKEMPVKSQVRGRVIKKTKNYFIADYLDEMPEMDVDALIAKYDNTEMEEICDLFSNNANITNFIKDYLLETRIPAIANHLREHFTGTVNEVSTEKYLKKYRKEAREIQEDYEDKTKKACDKKNVEEYGRKSKLHVLKEKLDGYKEDAFEQIIGLYNNYKSLGYCSKGRIADYMLYDEYMDFLLDEEKFRYDDENPYVVKMFKLLCKFIGVRSKIEKNMENLPSLISKFNKLCKSTLKKYWKPDGGDYYTEIKNIFRFDYYTNDTEQLIQALETDKNAVSLYSKVYDYLKAVCHYTTPKGETIEYSDDMDVNAALSSGKEDNTDRTMDTELRKIAFNFCLIRNVETSANDDNVYSSSIANHAIVTAFYYLHLIAGILVEDYDENYTGIDPVVLASQAILRPYLKSLKKITQSEALEMEKLGKEVIQWYYENGKKVNDPHLFDAFKEVPWGAMTKITYKNEYYNHTFLTYVCNDAETMLAKIEDEPFDFDTQEDSDEFYNKLNNLKSSYGPNTFPYWLRYLTIATIVNCMLPIYWGTGIIIMGVPIILPIIMMPIFVLPGRVTVVFGIGLCGICPMPLILFVNMGNVRASVLIPLNILADTLKSALKQVMNMQKKVIDLSYAPIITSLDATINQFQKELDDIDNQIHNIDSYIKNNKAILRNIKMRLKKDPTTQPEEN